MKKMLVFLLVPTLLLIGCADKEAYQEYLSNQNSSNKAYMAAAAKPLIDITLPSPDPTTPYKIVVNREVRPPIVQQIKDSEWVGPLGKLIGTAGIVGGAWVAADGAANLVEAVGKTAGGGNTTLNAGGDIRLDNVGNTHTASTTGDYSPASTTSTSTPSNTDDHTVTTTTTATNDDHATYGDGDVSK